MNTLFEMICRNQPEFHTVQVNLLPKQSELLLDMNSEKRCPKM